MSDRLGIADKFYTKRLPENFYMQLNPTDHIQQQLFWYGYYEKELGDILKKIIKPGDVFIDIGANIGYFSLLVANNVSTAKVISFEPLREIFEKLKENIAINNLKNITAFNAAVGEMKEEKELFIAGPDNSGMSSFQKPENFSGKKEIVQVVTIDEWFNRAGLAKIDVVKLDIEGNELAALKGMMNILQNFKPIVIVEINPETLTLFDLAPEDIYNFFRELNFTGFLVAEAGKLKNIGRSKAGETVNVLFSHQDKSESLSTLIIS